MKNVIKVLLRESLLREVRMGMDNLPPSTVLIVDYHSLTLYNTKMLHSDSPEKGVIGYISLMYENDFGEVSRVAALKGFGPFMYLLGAQYSHPTGIQSSRDGFTVDEALRLWDYFNSHSEELGIKIEHLKPGDLGYMDSNERGNIEDNPELFKIFNMVMYCQDTEDFVLLESYGDEFLEEVGDEYRDIISEYGENYFNERF